MKDSVLDALTEIDALGEKIAPDQKLDLQNGESLSVP